MGSLQYHIKTLPLDPLWLRKRHLVGKFRTWARELPQPTLAGTYVHAVRGDSDNLASHNCQLEYLLQTKLRRPVGRKLDAISVSIGKGWLAR